ncbi:MAG: sigma 54-interacting transcriptional regulator [Deltaproteobacteria bacterium]|nr:sigma 54-interacting transcriptional regulator [Deltaproteobacteria bacterium]
MTDRVLDHRYELIQRLGHGQAGVVYQAYDRLADRPCAIKLGTASFAEFRCLSEIQHPNIVPVFDVGRVKSGELQGHGYLVMGYVGGQNAQRLAPMAVAPAIQIARELCAALIALHQRGFVHRDLKPANVIVDDGRAVLVDFGLADRLGASAVSGTVDFMAPEALGGDAGPRSDLYSLGATLYFLRYGKPPLTAKTPRALIEKIFAEPVQIADDSGLSSIIKRLLEKDPARRYCSARAVLAALDRLVDARSAGEGRVSLVEPAFVGRAAARQAIAQTLARLGVGWVCGEAGIGKSALISAAVGDYRGRPDAQASVVDVAAMTAKPASIDDAAAELCQRLEAQARVAPLVAVFADLAEALQRRTCQMLLAVRQAERLPIAVIGESRDETAFEGVDSSPVAERIVLGPLDAGEARALVDGMVVGAGLESSASRWLFAASAGNPRLLSQLVAAWARGELAEAQVGADRLAEGPIDRRLERLLARRRAGCGALQRRLVDAVAIAARPVEPSELAKLLSIAESTVWATVGELVGLIGASQGRISIVSPVVQRSWLAALSEDQRQQQHRFWTLAADPDSDDETFHRLCAGVAFDEQQLTAALALLERLWHQDALRALMLVRQLNQAWPATPALVRCEARLRAQRGDYPAAAALLEPQRDATCQLDLADVKRRAGDVDGALRTLSAVDLGEESSVAEKLAARAQQALLAAKRGERERALQILGPLVEHQLHGPIDRLSDEEGCLVEAAALALMSDQPRVARSFLGLGQRACQDNPLRLARLTSLRGNLAFVGGELRDAEVCFRRALELAREYGDAHAAATYYSNLGSTMVERGQYTAAMELLDAAVRALTRLGRSDELSGATYNLAGAQLLLGNVAAAQRGLEQLERLDGDPCRSRGLALLLAADIARWRRDWSGSLELAERAEAFFDQATRGEASTARLIQIAALTALGRAQAAIVVEQREEQLCGRRAELRRLVAERWLSVWPDRPLPAAATTATEALAEHCARLEYCGALGALWRFSSTLGQLLVALGRRAAARGVLARAQEILELVMANSPDVSRAEMERDREVEQLRQRWHGLVMDDGAQDLPTVADGAPATALEQLRRLLRINRRINSELRLQPLLELIIDEVIAVSGAERGFLLLADDASDVLSVSVARNIERHTLVAKDPLISRSIAESAARQGREVVAVDALDDPRFSSSLSVSNLALRSVLALPLEVKGKTVGAIYVDHRFRPGVFGDEQLALTRDLCQQAAIAIENARLYEENERQRRSIEEMAQRLKQQVEHQAIELVAAEEQLKNSQRALVERYCYNNIVGATPPMLAMFRLLDRVSETDLPVVIFGKSGTGKELVARAIHHNGARKEGAFVGENCGAIPETLLESVLFGHTRGAFTGAERDRKGLFEIADRGTLFLDEVGEMSMAMQTKLLRVLQDGEIRRVGSERSISTDVRIIAASNRDLETLVKEGRFREDLFYRLNVVRVDIPTLAERRDDIPLLVKHFMQKHGQSRKLEISNGALARLVGFDWPGNVRQLENEIMRMVALAEDQIDVADLSPMLVDAVPLAIVQGEELHLRERVDHLERILIRDALQRTRGNQSRAARLLGLSRYGLLKKLRRYEEHGRPLARAGEEV